MNHKKLVPAYLLTFVNVLGFSMLIPVLPFVVDEYGAPKWIYGLLLTLYSAFQFFGSPFLGRLSDSMGRKPILLISQAGTLLSWFVFLGASLFTGFTFLGIAVPILIIALSRVLDGITGGNVSVTNAYVGDITSKEQKSYIFGYLGGIVGLGMIVGPGIGGISAGTAFGYHGTLIIAIIISSITLAVIYFSLNESLKPENKKPKERQTMLQTINIMGRINQLNPNGTIRLMFTTKFFFAIMMACYVSTIALFVIDIFNFNAQQLGMFMFAVGFFLIINQTLISPQVIKRIGSFNTLLVGMSLTVLGLLCITLTKNLVLYLSFYYIMNLGLSLCFPTFNSIISINADPKSLGETMGISESIQSICNAIFPVIAAAIYGWIGYKLYYVLAVLPFIALLIALKEKRKLSEV